MDGKAEQLQKILARVVRERRRELGLTQEELAHRAGLSMRYVSLLETCKHQPTLATLRGLSEGLEMSLTELIGTVEARSRQAP